MLISHYIGVGKTASNFEIPFRKEKKHRVTMSFDIVHISNKFKDEKRGYFLFNEEKMTRQKK
jgi:hypothetical protein